MKRRGRRSTAILKALNRVLMVLAFLGVLCLIGLWFYPQLRTRDRMVRDLEEKQAQLAKEEALNRRQVREVYLLENDPEYIEIIARDRLDLMKEGETIFRLDSARAEKTGGR